MKAIRIEAPGGPEVLVPAEIDDPRPKAGEALVRVEAIGVNFIEVYQRTGLYPMQLPLTPGSEAAGTIVELADESSYGFKPGDRVAWQGSPGAYAELAAVRTDLLVAIPDAVSTDQAAAVMIQGMTAHYLINSTFPLEKGDTCLIHAAGGGVGLLFCQIASRLGVRVIGTASTDEKSALARQAGAEFVIDYTKVDFAAEVRRLTDGRGVDVVYDSVGKATWEKSIECLVPRGMLVLFGNASGPPPPIDPLMLSRKGSLYVTRPTLAHYLSSREELLERAGFVLDAVASESLKVRIDSVFPLAEAADAHRRIESRQSSGKILLRP